MWIKRGDFVVVKPIEEGDKVKAEILTILYKEQIKYIKAENQWPAGFEAAKVEEEEGEEGEQKDKGSEEEEGDSEDDSDLFQNTNRPIYSESESSDETESEEEK